MVVEAQQSRSGVNRYIKHPSDKNHKKEGPRNKRKGLEEDSRSHRIGKQGGHGGLKLTEFSNPGRTQRKRDSARHPTGEKRGILETVRHDGETFAKTRNSRLFIL